MCAIADTYGFTPSAVQGWKKRGVDIWDDSQVEAHAAKCKARLLSDDEKRAAVDLYEQGYGSQAIGKKLGREKTSIRAYLREVGLWTSERTKQSPAQRRKLVFGETDPRQVRKTSKKRTTEIRSLPLFSNIVRDRYRYRYRNDREFRLIQILRRRLRKVALRGRGYSGRVLPWLGCTPEFLVHWLESQFEPGMSWENLKPGVQGWHIDHRRPCCWFDMDNAEERSICFHFTNLRPRWGRENIIDGQKQKAQAQIVRVLGIESRAGIGSAL